MDNQKFEFNFNQISRNVLSFKGEIIEAAQLCKEKANGRIVLCFSGGLDSELAFKALQYVGANFTAITYVYNNWCNHYDLINAQKTYDELSFPKRMIELDIERIINYEVDAYREQGYYGNNIYRYMHMEFIKKAYEFGDFPIVCGGEQRFMMKNLDDNVMIGPENILRYKEKQNETGIAFHSGTTNVLEYLKNHKLNANPYFLYSTPELMAAYQQIPIIDFSLREKDFYSSAAMTFGMKNIAYHNVWPELRVRRKSNGFDDIRPEYQKKFADKIKSHNETEQQSFWLSLAELRTQLGLMDVNQVI